MAAKQRHVMFSEFSANDVRRIKAAVGLVLAITCASFVAMALNSLILNEMVRGAFFISIMCIYLGSMFLIFDVPRWTGIVCIMFGLFFAGQLLGWYVGLAAAAIPLGIAIYIRWR